MIRLWLCVDCGEPLPSADRHCDSFPVEVEPEPVIKTFKDRIEVRYRSKHPQRIRTAPGWNTIVRFPK